MNYSSALILLKNGHLLQRAGWNGKGMFIYHVPGSKFRVNRAPLMGIFPEGTEVEYGAHIDIKAADGVCRPWLASQDDQLAEDWQTVERPEVTPGLTLSRPPAPVTGWPIRGDYRHGTDLHPEWPSTVSAPAEVTFAALSDDDD